MSTREKIISEIDELNDKQLNDLLAFLVAYKKSEREDDEFCQKLLEDYLNDDSPDKHESLTLEELTAELKIKLNEVYSERQK